MDKIYIIYIVYNCSVHIHGVNSSYTCRLQYILAHAIRMSAYRLISACVQADIEHARGLDGVTAHRLLTFSIVVIIDAQQKIHARANVNFCGQENGNILAHK